MIVAPDRIADRVKKVRDRIESAAVSCGRNPESVKIVAASKTVPVDRIEAAMHAGIRVFGENYVQEAEEKIETLGRDRVSWHFVGHLQTNKAKYAVRLFDLIHSVDSLKIARELDRRARGVGTVQKILIQVNVSGEESKSGIDTAHTLDLVREVSTLENLTVCGLMTMPPYFNSPEKVRPHFRTLKALQIEINKGGDPNLNIAELSMGMSGDFETAIEEGATLVRIGTAIFGERGG
jgi:pyridoxal phosphate enzyme (YggS family)